jgi:C4-dicarboxylate-binding protein DctP
MLFILTLAASSITMAAEEPMNPPAIPPDSQTTETRQLVMSEHPEAEIIIKFSHAAAPDSPKGQAAERFKQLAEQNTNGRVRVDISPSSQLYNDSDEFEALQSGAVQMLAPALSRFVTVGVREFQLFDLPYVFPNRKILHRVMDADVGKGLFRKLSAKGLTGLAYWDNGFKQMSSNKAMRKVTDLKGLKISVQPSRVIESQMKFLAASPQVLPSGEVYAALQQGMVDGTEKPVSNFYAQKLHEVQKHLTISNHGYLGYAVVVNKKFWGGLPADTREALSQAMKEATLFERDLAQQENDAALANVIAANTTEVYVLSPRERTAWQLALLPVYQEFEDVIGKYLIKSVAYTAQQVFKEQNEAKSKAKKAAAKK